MKKRDEANKKTDRIRSILINLILAFISFIIILILIEAVSFIIINLSGDKYDVYKTEETIENNYLVYETFDSIKDQYLGYSNRKNHTNSAIVVFKNNTVVYNVTQESDQYGRRTIHQEYRQNNSHLLLFGGSFTFGDAIKDNETLQYFLSKELPEYNIYKYAVGGYGPQHILALLENRDLVKEVGSNKGDALYFILLPDHIWRAVGSTREEYLILPKNYASPYYRINEQGKLERKGSFITGRFIIGRLLPLFYYIKSHSNFMRLINIDFPFKIREKHLQLTCEIIDKSKELYEAEFDGNFYVIMHPLSGHKYDEYNLIRENMIKELKERDISVLEYPSIKDLNKFRIPYDGHPNAELNKILSSRIAGTLDNAGRRDTD